MSRLWILKGDSSTVWPLVEWLDSAVHSCVALQKVVPMPMCEMEGSHSLVRTTAVPLCERVPVEATNQSSLA